MIVAIDIDDVLSDTITALVSYYNSLYAPKITESDLEKFSYWGFLGETREEGNRKYFAFSDSKYFDLIVPNPGAQEVIEKLTKKHKLVLISGRPLFLKEKTEQWVAKYFPNCFQGIYFTNDRMDRTDYSPYWGRKKADICDQVGAEVLVDDLFEYISGTEHIRVILFDQVWNRKDAPAHTERAKGWQMVGELLS